tara:strand:+ start:1883 stop:2296 length:414 start_codon:yes stop_codon:yes gene_type:complete
MNNQHEIAMVRHWICKAIYSQAKNAKYYRTYAEHADVWANKALAKGRNTERKDAMRMTRKDNAMEVLVCLLSVSFLLIIATISTEHTVAAISYTGAGLFFLIGIAYTWQECRYRKIYQEQLNARLDEVVEGGLDVRA